MTNIFIKIKKVLPLLLHTILTALLCWLGSYAFKKLPFLTIYGNIVLFVILVCCIYRMFSKKQYSDSYLKICSVVFITISINHFFEIEKIKTLLILTSNLGYAWKVLLVSGSILIFILIYQFLVFLENSNNVSDLQHKNSAAVEQNFKGSNHSNVGASSNTFDYSNNFSFIQFLCVFIVFCIVLVTPAVILHFFYKNNLDITSLEFDKVFSFIISYGSSFFLILFAIVFAILVLIYVAEKIRIKIIKLKTKSENTIDTVPTYVFSIIVVCVLMYLAWRISDITLEDFRNTLVNGDYLALPLSVLVIMILFFLLIQITHAIILMIKGMSASQIKATIEKKIKELNIFPRVFDVIKAILDIVLDTMKSTLDFVKFIPSFFTEIYQLVLADDDEINNAKFENDSE